MRFILAAEVNAAAKMKNIQLIVKTYCKAVLLKFLEKSIRHFRLYWLTSHSKIAEGCGLESRNPLLELFS